MISSLNGPGSSQEGFAPPEPVGRTENERERRERRERRGRVTKNQGIGKARGGSSRVCIEGDDRPAPKRTVDFVRLGRSIFLETANPLPAHLRTVGEISVTPGKIYIGTSGWVYKDWASHFYPKEIPKKQYLDFYAAQFPR